MESQLQGTAKQLKYTFKGKLQSVLRTSAGFFFHDDENYYGIAVGYDLDDSYKVFRFAGRNEIVKISDEGLAEFSDGTYKKLILDQYADKPQTVLLKNFPKGAQILHYADDYGILLKNRDGIFLYNLEKGRSEKITGLDPKSAVFQKSPEDMEPHFLYDADTFYVIEDNLLDYENVTDQFSEFEVNFLKLQFIVSSYIDSVFWQNKKNDILWAYSPNSVNGLNFNPLKGAKFLNESNSVFQYNDQYYLFLLEAIIGSGGTDVESVKNINALVPAQFSSNLYQYGSGYYDYDGEAEVFIKVYFPVSSNAVYYQGVNSYMHGFAGFYDDGGQILFFDGHNYKMNRKTPHKSSIRNLVLAYAFDDQLLIEGKLIKSTADLQTMEFLKSTVVPVQPCAGEFTNSSVLVNYIYYFKDKNNFYRYTTGDKSLTKLGAAEIKKEDLEQIAEANMRKEQNFTVLNLKSFGIASVAGSGAGAAVWFWNKRRNS